MLSAVKRPYLLFASVALALVAAPALAQSSPPPPGRALPPLPGANAPARPGAQEAPAGLPTPQQLYEHVRRGVVAIEHNGMPMAIGTILGGDGRILTALSGLGGADNAEVRYADGTTVHAKLGHSDKDTDLALLVPQAGKWTDGLTASEADPSGSELRAMLPSVRGAHLGPAEAGVKGRVDAHARDGVPLLQMLDVNVKGPLIAGTPLLDSTGSVVGVLVRACKGAPQPAGDSPWAAWSGQAQAAAMATACSPVVVGAPVASIRSFLSKTPPTAVAPAPFLGIQGETEAAGAVHGVRIVAVAPKSPAETAGLKPSTDVIVAVDGQPIETPDRLSEAIAKHAAVETVKLLVFSGDKFREVPVALGQAR
jgi:serine protease Do